MRKHAEAFHANKDYKLAIIVVYTNFAIFKIEIINLVYTLQTLFTLLILPIFNMKMNHELKNELCFTLHEAYDKVYSPCGPVFPTGLILTGPFFCQVHRPGLLGLQKKNEI